MRRASLQYDEGMTVMALVLDVAHRGKCFACEPPAGARALAAVKAAVRAASGVDLAGPYGTHDGDFVFVAPGAGGGAWPRVGEWSVDERAWRLYVDGMLGGWQPPSRFIDVFHFGGTPEAATRLAHLVVKGGKRATTGWKRAAALDGTTVPHVGLVSIVTDGFGVPLCAIETVSVEERRFREVDAELAEAEGEGDRTLDDWREGHLRHFQGEAAALGLAFSEDEVVFFERFRVLAVLERLARTV